MKLRALERRLRSADRYVCSIAKNANDFGGNFSNFSPLSFLARNLSINSFSIFHPRLKSSLCDSLHFSNAWSAVWLSKFLCLFLPLMFISISFYSYWFFSVSFSRSSTDFQKAASLWSPVAANGSGNPAPGHVTSSSTSSSSVPGGGEHRSGGGGGGAAENPRHDGRHYGNTSAGLAHWMSVMAEHMGHGHGHPHAHTHVGGGQGDAHPAAYMWAGGTEVTGLRFVVIGLILVSPRGVDCIVFLTTGRKCQNNSCVHFEN